MSSTILSRHDVSVLDKIKDPESDPSTCVLVDASLPRDPNVTDTALYEIAIQRERDIVLSMQYLELQLAGLRPRSVADPVREYKVLLSKLDDLISENPNYASARNNRIQALRRLYGDTMLLAKAPATPQRLIESPDGEEVARQVQVVLSDIDKSISLLTPRTIYGAMSPQAAKTLSLTHTQRAAIYHTTAKLAAEYPLNVGSGRREFKWTKLDFEEAASHDFAMGGRYGNEIAKGLAVSANPTAKLCGQMVREAMKKEYGPSFGD
ncbi:Tetratricopeptide repeat protein 36-like protein [Colletotrichum sidae]|uniref:Tetratricopeptide repeat protein 36-like protein n=1 Tax=Colletotrichum sidae TaxID=1347389 RepID=A0A4R8SX83_9PEZI|nr:Tetratricopeptide repeat protein 36-like protein [Colletotrichum sidae]